MIKVTMTDNYFLRLLQRDPELQAVDEQGIALTGIKQQLVVVNVKQCGKAPLPDQGLGEVVFSTNMVRSVFTAQSSQSCLIIYDIYLFYYTG